MMFLRIRLGLQPESHCADAQPTGNSRAALLTHRGATAYNCLRACAKHTNFFNHSRNFICPGYTRPYGNARGRIDGSTSLRAWTLATSMRTIQRSFQAIADLRHEGIG